MDNTVTLQAVWPKEDREALKAQIEELNQQLEKANTLADALAQKMKEIEISMEFEDAAQGGQAPSGDVYLDGKQVGRRLANSVS